MTAPSSPAPGRFNLPGILIGVGLLALAGAIAWYGAVNRYDFSNLNAREMTRRDRLTGDMLLCARKEGGNLECKKAWLP